MSELRGLFNPKDGPTVPCGRYNCRIKKGITLSSFSVWSSDSGMLSGSKSGVLFDSIMRFESDPLASRNNRALCVRKS